jgi:hypothetical protein
MGDELQGDLRGLGGTQRIKGLSLGSAIKHALFANGKPKARKQVVKTLIDTFRYPRQGAELVGDPIFKSLGVACRAEPVLHLSFETIRGSLEARLDRVDPLRALVYSRPPAVVNAR